MWCCYTKYYDSYCNSVEQFSFNICTSYLFHLFLCVWSVLCHSSVSDEEKDGNFKLKSIGFDVINATVLVSCV